MIRSEEDRSRVNTYVACLPPAVVEQWHTMNPYQQKRVIDYHLNLFIDKLQAYRLSQEQG